MQFEADKLPEKLLQVVDPTASPRSFSAKSGIESPFTIRTASVREKLPAEKGPVTLKIITELSKLSE